MNTQWLLIAAILMAFVVVAAMTQKGGLGPSEKPRRRWVLSKNESAMYHRLIQSLPDKVVLAQVSFGALLTARSRGARNRFDRKIADFVVCDKAMQVLVAPEPTAHSVYGTKRWSKEWPFASNASNDSGASRHCAH